MMLTDEARSFLGGVPPFQLLEEQTVQELAETVSQEFYPKGTPILTEGGPPSDCLQVIVSGNVKVSLGSGGQELVIDYRSEGDSLGFLSLVSGDRARTNVVAIEDTTCYLIPREVFLPLLDAHPAIREYYQRTFLARYLDKAFSDMRNRSLFAGGGEKLLFSTPVGELATRPLVSAPVEVSIRRAAEIMSQNAVSSLVLVDSDGSPAGMVTDRDLRDKVAAKARDVEAPAASIMSAALIKADAREYCFEALLKMIRHKIHHLLVVDHGRLKGVVTNHDLMVLQGTSPLSIVREIESQQEVGGLAQAGAKTDSILGLLLKEGARAGNIHHIVTELNDRLVRRVIELAERACGPPPVPYSWITCGSAGRKEQVFRTDQDNAIVHAATRSPEQAAAAREYFARFAGRVKEDLVRCGFAPCPADHMASNPRWCQPLGAWKEYFTRWITSPSPEQVPHSLVFFDFRHLAGAAGLAEELRAHVALALKNQNIFLAQVAGAIVRHRPPLGFFGNFVVEKGGRHRNQLNLKASGLGPIADIARLCALAGGVAETSTLERLHALQGRHALVTSFGEEMAHAFEFLSLLSIHRRHDQLQAGRPLDNFLDPEELSTLERKTLKDTFRLISRVQDLLIEEYGPGLVGG